MTGTERKVFQKYYPPDFDPSKIPKASGPRNRQFVQRVMTPCNMKCNTCGEYIYKAKKFNMRRETAEGEDYLGLRIFRFYFRCPNCLAEITFKTDLENCDYALEQGATRLFEAHKLYRQQLKEEEEKEAEDATNPMKMLEKRTKMSRAEMEAIGTLEEIRELNRRNMAVEVNSMIGNTQIDAAELLRRQEEEDEEEIKKLFPKNIKVEEDEGGGLEPVAGPSRKIVKRIKEESDDETEDMKPSAEALEKLLAPLSSSDFKLSSQSSSSLPAASLSKDKPPAKKAKLGSATVSSQRTLIKGLVKPKGPTQETMSNDKEKASSNTISDSNSGSMSGKPGGSGLGLLGSYGSSSGSDSEGS